MRFPDLVYTDQVEPFGLDKRWLDVTGSVGPFGSPMTIAKEISDRIKLELGITAGLGASDNKSTAKLGSNYKKPDAIHLKDCMDCSLGKQPIFKRSSFKF